MTDKKEDSLGKPSDIYAQRLTAFRTHFFAGVAAQIQQMQMAGKTVIRMDEGAPDLPPPKHIIEALCRSASQPGSHSYQSQRGTARLRSAWAQMYARLYGIMFEPETEILPLLGTKEGIFHFPLTFINPGDIVLIPDPGYITYTRGALLAGAQPFSFPLHAENGYLPKLEEIPAAVLDRAKMMWLNYPNNPTAAFAPLSFFEEVVEFARKHHILLCHDAAYNQITFNGRPAPSIFQIPGAKEVAVEFHTLSKSHNMAGWRVGAVFGDEKYLRPFYSLKTNMDSGHFLPVLEAATEAMTGDQSWLEERNRIYQRRRDLVVAALQRMGLQAQVPQGSLYVWCPIPGGWAAEEFTRHLLVRACVSLTPGTVFGENGKGFVRISITLPEEQIIRAMGQMEEALQSLQESEVE